MKRIGADKDLQRASHVYLVFSVRHVVFRVCVVCSKFMDGERHRLKAEKSFLLVSAGCCLVTTKPLSFRTDAATAYKNYYLGR